MTQIRSKAAHAACLFLLAAGPVQAQSFADRLGNIAERAIQSEIERKVDREVRKVTRCVLGDERCVRDAERRGEQVEIVQVGQPQAVGTTGNSALSNVDPGGDHPLVQPYLGSTNRKRDFSAFDEETRIIGTQGARRDAVTERLEGRVTRLQYRYPKGRSALEVMRNYRNTLVAQGYRVEFEMGPGSHSRGKPMNDLFGAWRYMTGRMPYNGGTAFITIAVGEGNIRATNIRVVETAGMDTNMVASDAGAMAASIERDGRVTLDGIHFDTARATLRAESSHTLDQIALLLREQAQLRLLIVGHTDSTGSATANQTLSQQRAESVRNALAARGISSQRLTPVGAGSGSPIADNSTESGRAMNRRVELVRQ